MNLGTQSDAAKDPDRLEREIDEQRREINETLRALEEKFSSRELASQFAHYFTGPGREWIDTLGSSVKSNPVPTLLTAVGLAWLMMSDRHRSTYRGPYRMQRAYGTGYRAEYAGEYPPGYGEDQEGRLHGMMNGAAGSAHAMHDAAHSAYERAGEKAGELRERAAEAGASLHDKAAHMRESLHDRAAHMHESLHDRAAHAREALHDRREAWHARAHDARGGLQHSAETLRDNFSRVAHEQPLALGALGIALGAIIGAALPRTEHENRVLGRASERMKEKGREMAQSGYEQASRKAAEVVEAAEATLQGSTDEQRGASEQHMWQGSSDSAGTPRQQPDAGASQP